MIKRLSTLFIIMLISTISYQQNPLSVNFSTASTPTPGQPFDVDVRVSDFDDLLSFQIFVLWDSLVLEIDTIPFVSSSLPDFDDSGITLPSETASMEKGNVRANWFSFTLSPESLPDDHLLFTMRFNPIGNDCDTTSIKIGNLGFSMNEAIDENGEDIGVISNKLEVMIPGADCGGGGGGNDGVGLIFSDQFVEPSTNVCFPMTVENFDSIVTFQGSAMWDPAVLSFTGVQSFGLPGFSEGGFNLDNTDSGVLTYLWFDLSGTNPATIPDGGTVFEICFDVVGSLGQSTILKAFDGTPPETTPIQISKDSGVVDYFVEEGAITVSDGLPMFFTIDAAEVIACNGDTACVDFTTENFDDIAAFQLTMTWDTLLMTYNSVTNLNATIGLFESFFNLESTNKLAVTWSDANASGVSLPDGAVLYSVCFDVNPSATEGESTSVDIIDDRVPIEVINGDTEEIPYEMLSGSVTVGCNINIQIVTSDPLCPGASNGTINVQISGGTSPYDCVFEKVGGSTTTIDDETTNCLLPGQSAGEFIITVTDDDGNSVTQMVSLTDPEEMMITGSTTPETCDMLGTITFDVTGGTGTITTSFDPSVNPSSAEAGTYVLTAEDENGCTATESFTVMDGCTEPVVIDAEITNPTECDPCGVVSVTCSGGSGNFTVSYSPAIFDLDCVPAGSYMVTCTDDAGNSETLAFVVMEENAMPINTDYIEIIPADCDMSNGQVNYNLSGGCGELTCMVSPDIANPNFVSCESIGSYAAGDYILMVTDEDGNTAMVNFNVPVNIDEPLMVTVNGTTAADCDNLGSVELAITGGCNPEFVISDGTTMYTSTMGLPEGDYTVTVTDDTNTTRTAFFSIDSNTGVGPLTIDEIVVVNAPCDSGFGSASFDYSGGCEPVTGSLEMEGVGTIDFDGSELAPGNYTLSYRDNAGTSVTQDFSVGSDGPPIVITVDENTNCAISITASGGQAPYTYLWTFPSGTTSNAEDLVDIPQNGSYMLVVMDSNGCEARMTVTVTDCNEGMALCCIEVTSDFEGFGTPCAVNSNPCEGEGVIDGTIINGNAPFTITLTNQELEVFTFSDFPLTGVCAGNYTVVVEDSSGEEVEWQQSVDVTSPDPITIELDGSVTCEDEGMSNGAIETIVSGGVGGYTYTWTPMGSSGPDNLDIPAGMYILTVEDNNLCTAQMLFEVRDCNVPGECYEAISVMSPNNDGINDLFVISCASNTANQLAIFNRFGQKVFEATNYNNDWDGIDLDGVELDEGAYYWVLQLNFNNGESRIEKGTVTILKN